jgi:hypothetical protein
MWLGMLFQYVIFLAKASPVRPETGACTVGATAPTRHFSFAGVEVPNG